MKDGAKPGLLALPADPAWRWYWQLYTRVVLWFLPPRFGPHGVLLLCCVAWVGGCVLEHGTMQQFLVNVMLHAAHRPRTRM